ncbi:MAG: hypothetical protein HWN67_06490 [Candidatus Helarchaeota archaeon]|nr:hypothetical protein [Candidatus Helarchaeota archaeon]
MNLISKDAKIGKNVKTKQGVIIEDGAVVGDNCLIGYNSIIKSNVHLGSNSVIGDFVVLGQYIEYFHKDETKKDRVGYLQDPEGYINPVLKIGENANIRSYTLIYADCEIGDKFETGSWIMIRQGCKIGYNNYVGNHSEFWGPLEIGDHNRFINLNHLGDTTVVKNFTWWFPYSGAATDLHPPCGKCIKGPVVEDYVIVGSIGVLLPRITVGKSAIIGALSLVTRDVPPETIVMGNPAKVVKNIRDIKCPLGIIDHPYPWQETMDKERGRRYGYPW